METKQEQTNIPETCPFCHRPIGIGKEKEKHLFEIKKLNDQLGRKPEIQFVTFSPYDPFKKVRKKLAKLERKFEAAKGKPLVRARVLRAAVPLEIQLQFAQVLTGGFNERKKSKDNSPSGEKVRTTVSQARSEDVHDRPEDRTVGDAGVQESIPSKQEVMEKA